MCAHGGWCLCEMMSAVDFFFLFFRAQNNSHISSYVNDLFDVIIVFRFLDKLTAMMAKNGPKIGAPYGCAKKSACAIEIWWTTNTTLRYFGFYANRSNEKWVHESAIAIQFWFRWMKVRVCSGHNQQAWRMGAQTKQMIQGKQNESFELRRREKKATHTAISSMKKSCSNSSNTRTDTWKSYWGAGTLGVFFFFFHHRPPPFEMWRSYVNWLHSNNFSLS